MQELEISIHDSVDEQDKFARALLIHPCFTVQAFKQQLSELIEDLPQVDKQTADNQTLPDTSGANRALNCTLYSARSSDKTKSLYPAKPPCVVVRAKSLMVKSLFEQLQSYTLEVSQKNPVIEQQASLDQKRLHEIQWPTKKSSGNGKFIGMATLAGVNAVGLSFNASSALLGLIPGISSAVLTTGASLIALGGLMLFAGFELKKIAEEFNIRLLDLKDLISEHLKYQILIEACFRQTNYLLTEYNSVMEFLDKKERDEWEKRLSSVSELLQILSQELNTLRAQYTRLQSKYSRSHKTSRMIVTGVFGVIYALNGLYAGATFGMYCCHVGSFIGLMSAHPMIISIVLACAALFCLGTIISFIVLERAGAMEIVDRLFGRPHDKIKSFVATNEESLKETIEDKKKLIAEKTKRLVLSAQVSKQRDEKEQNSNNRNSKKIELAKTVEPSSLSKTKITKTKMPSMASGYSQILRKIRTSNLQNQRVMHNQNPMMASKTNPMMISKKREAKDRINMVCRDQSIQDNLVSRWRRKASSKISSVRSEFRLFKKLRAIPRLSTAASLSHSFKNPHRDAQQIPKLV